MVNSNKKTRSANPVLPSTPSSTGGSHRSTVLVIDDDRRFAETIAASLEDLGVDVLIAFDGNAGLAVAMAKKPALILLDSRMPYRSGYLVLEYLATDTDLQIPTIVLSENEGRRHRDYAKMLGAIDYLEKPINAVELASQVTAWLAEFSADG